MYSRRFNCRSKKWDYTLQLSKCLNRPNQRQFPHHRYTYQKVIPGSGNHHRLSGLVHKLTVNPIPFPGLSSPSNYIGYHEKFDTCLTCTALRFYSSKGDGRNESEDKLVPAKDSNFEKGKIRREKVKTDVRHTDEHARLGVQDQKEWLNNERLSIESKKKESPFISKLEKFKNEFLRRVVPWDKITVSLDTFPYYINEHTKNLLVECAASHLKHKKFAVSYGSRLDSSSGRILLQSVPGTELYQERLVRALARELQVPLLTLDCSVLAPYDFGEDQGSENESDDDNAELGEELPSESQDEHDASSEGGYLSSSEVKSDGTDDDEVNVQGSAEVLRKLVPYAFEGTGKGDIGEAESNDVSEKSDAAESPEQLKRPLKKGDRVKYVGPPVYVEADNSKYHLFQSSGQRGEVYEVDGDQAAVILDGIANQADGDKDEKSSEQGAQPSIYWIRVQDIELDLDMQSEDWYIAMEALWEALPSMQPLIIYFPDSYQWLSRAVPKSKRKDFVRKVEEMFDQLSGPVVLICGQNKVEAGTGSKDKETFTMVLPGFGHLGKLPLSLKRLTEGLRATKRSQDDDLYKLFNNVLCLHPPKEEELLRTFNKQIEDDRKIIISRSNLIELHKVLEEHELSCMELLHVNTDGVILTKQKAEKVVGRARNHYLSTCTLPLIKGDKLNVPRGSLENAISRLREQEMISAKPSQNLKNLAKGEYETNFISAVVPPDEIGVMFDDIGALEDVKRTLNELVILPMRRPELFLHGNLLRPCKGILLFGPPGTGKTLLAKALATEAGANFISITGSTLTSKAGTVIVFVDEIDSLLGARGGAFEHEATRRMRNEFMAAWDGLRSKESQRILILGATNRPFDLDDAVIRRLPRRIYVDLPDAENRMKILKIVLSKENLEADFRFDELANATEGYSGSDLKNLCIAAAYRPVQDFLKEDKKDVNNPVPVLRQLNLDDFIQAKSKVGASVAYDATSMNELRKWNEQYGEGGSRRKSPFGFGN